MGEKRSDKFRLRIRLPRNSRDILHAANLRHGTDGTHTYGELKSRLLHDVARMVNYLEQFVHHNRVILLKW